MSLSAEDLKHARVARLSKGEHISVVDAAQDYFECEVLSLDSTQMVVRIAQKLDAPQKKVHLTLVQGVAKGEKMELVIRHSTELGVESFVPLSCERSIVKLTDKKAVDRVVRWNNIAKSAAMQSGQPFIPVVSDIEKLPTLCKRLHEYDGVFICWEEAPVSRSLKAALDTFRCGRSAHADIPHIAVVVGPEGGLSQREVDTLLDACPGAQLVSLGSSILRTETAGIVAPALVLYEMGELGGSPGEVS